MEHNTGHNGQQYGAYADNLYPVEQSPGAIAADTLRRVRVMGGAAVAILFIVLGGAVYSNVLANGIFVFDDFEYVKDNPILQDLSGILAMGDPRQVGYLSFALNYVVDNSWEPFGFHLVNVAIHIATAIMMFFLVRDMAGAMAGPGTDEAASGRGQFIALLGSLLFLVHPLQTQAVSYVTQRFTSLSTFFYVAAIVSYLSCRIRLERSEHGQTVYFLFAASMACTVLAMKTKEIAFTLPFMMGAFEVLVFRGSVFSLRRFFFLIPFLATLVIIPVSLFGPEWGLTGAGQGVDEVTRRDKIFDLFQRSGYEYLITQFRVIVTYIRLMVLPVNQLAVYDFRASKSFFEPSVLLSLLALLGLAGSAVYAWRRAGSAAGHEAVSLKLFSVGILWFFVALSIESSVIPIKDVIFEHRAYLPSVGFFTVIAVVWEKATRRVLPAMDTRIRMAVLAAVIILPLSVAAYVRNQIWTNEVLFWDDIVKKTGKAIGYNNRGNAYLKEGRYDLAIRDLTTTVGFFPSATDRMAWENADFTPTNMAKTYMSRGNAYAAMGDMERAGADFAMAKQMMQPMLPMRPGSGAP